jgi:hypothetical protein
MREAFVKYAAEHNLTEAEADAEWAAFEADMNAIREEEDRENGSDCREVEDEDCGEECPCLLSCSRIPLGHDERDEERPMSVDEWLADRDLRRHF